MSYLGERTTQSVRFSAPSQILVLPVGSLEQHGPHLPLDTDSQITSALAAALERKFPEQVVVAPVLPFGSSGEHKGFSGTLSIGAEVLFDAVVELIRSASEWRGVLLVTTHGGNAPILMRAVELLQGESRWVDLWYPTRATFQDAGYRWEIDFNQRGIFSPDLHAGRTETSIMLALSPDQVRMDLAAPGFVGEDPQALRTLVREGVIALSESGVLGDPSGASAEEGCLLLAAMIEELVSLYEKSPAWKR